MYDLWTTLATFTLLVLSAWLGRFIRPRMPETYRARETIETMQLVIGMLVTFAALVLSLLTASVKTTYDHAARDRQAYALRLGTCSTTACATLDRRRQRRAKTWRATRRR